MEPKIYADDNSYTGFTVEDDIGDARDATPEEVTSTVEEWEQIAQNANENIQNQGYEYVSESTEE